jgi:hypothetical protein
MRRIVACVALAIAATAIAAPAQAQGPRDCYDEFQRDGRSVEVFCGWGGPGRFQAVAHCSNGRGFYWEQYGSIGRVRGLSSFAECTSLLGYPQIHDYHVRWL